jgi:ABC-type methionine transport system permease subunit
MNEILGLLLPATAETLGMVGIAAILSGATGLLLGLLLVVASPGLYRLLSAVTNFGRSVPFIIIVVAIVPLTRLIAGTSIGTRAAIVPLVVGSIPYVARLVEVAIREVEPGVVEAVQAMGATTWQLVSKVYLPEALPSLVRAMTVMAITLLNYSAMVGAIGGGGLGDLAIRYGYQRFRPDIMVVTVLVLVVLVQVLQISGDRIASRLDRR